MKDIIKLDSQEIKVTNKKIQVIMTTQAEDRYGDTVNIAGMDMTRFLQNPALLDFHSKWDTPVGKCVNVVKSTDNISCELEFFKSDRDPLLWTERDKYIAMIEEMYQKGIMKAATQNIEVSGKELEQLKTEATMELLLDPASFGITLSYEGTEKINANDAHKIKMTLPSGIRWFAYFDAESGLKVKEQKEMQTQMGLIEQVITYDNYTDVEGIKYPFKLTQSFGPQSVEMTVSSVKVNKGLSDDLFVITE